VQAKQFVLHARMLTSIAKLMLEACLGLTVVHHLLVSEVRVHFNLQYCGLDACIAQQVINLLAAEVGNANMLDKTIIHKLLHCLPCVLIEQDKEDSSLVATAARSSSWLSTGRCLIDCTFGFCNNRARFLHFSFACMGFSELEAHTADVATPVLGFIQLICMFDLRDFCCDAMWPYGRQHNTRYTAMHRSNAQGRG